MLEQMTVTVPQEGRRPVALGRSLFGRHRHLPGSRKLADDAILEVNDPGRFDRPHLLEFDAAADALEEACLATEKERDDVQFELVDQRRRQY
jgi:hypothetical protein